MLAATINRLIDNVDATATSLKWPLGASMDWLSILPSPYTLLFALLLLWLSDVGHNWVIKNVFV